LPYCFGFRGVQFTAITGKRTVYQSHCMHLLVQSQYVLSKLNGVSSCKIVVRKFKTGYPKIYYVEIYFFSFIEMFFVVKLFRIKVVDVIKIYICCAPLSMVNCLVGASCRVTD
jgi:hypothetical protein